MTYKDIIRAQQQAHAGDTSALSALLSDEFTWTSVSKSAVGIAERNKAMTLAWATSLPDRKISKARALLETDDVIVGEEHAHSDNMGDHVFMTFYRLSGGKIIELRHVRGVAPE